MPPASAELDALRNGDEMAFADLARRHYPAMLRVASGYVRDREAADDVIQETWLTFLTTLDRFEGRSSLKTWLFGILVNVARSRRRRESRLIPFTNWFSNFDRGGPTVEPRRFDRTGTWRDPPAPWSELPEAQLTSKETLGQIQAAIAGLPPKLREVIVLRDVEGWSATEVETALSISPENQRVRLHRARAAVRKTLEAELA